MSDSFDKLFDELFGDDLDDLEAELDELDELDDDSPEEEPDGASLDEEEDPDLAELRKAREARGIVPGGSDPAPFGPGPDEDDEEFYEDTEVGGEYDASCPWCGEPVSIFLDPAGGSVQDYVEDCSVCCQPMAVTVRFVGGGQAEVSVDTAG